MEKKGNIVGIILARGKSKAVPRKNIRMVAGKPLIAYTIEAANKSKLLSRTVFSTEDDEIARIAREYGADVPFKRPEYLAEDTAHTPDVIEHAVRYLEENENYPVYAVVCLQPTSPLRKAEHIDMAVKKFLEEDNDSLVSIKKAKPPWWNFKIEGNVAVPFIEYRENGKFVNPHNRERQEFPPTYALDGVIMIVKRDYLKKTGNLINPRKTGYINFNDDEVTLDIDSEVDLKIAEEIIKERASNKT